MIENFQDNSFAFSAPVVCGGSGGAIAMPDQESLVDIAVGHFDRLMTKATTDNKNRSMRVPLVAGIW